MNVMPMTSFLFTYMKKVQKWNEKDSFEYDDWLSYIDTLNTIAQHNSIKDLEFKAPPGKSIDKTLHISDVIRKMQHAS